MAEEGVAVGLEPWYACVQTSKQTHKAAQVAVYCTVNVPNPMRPTA